MKKTEISFIAARARGAMVEVAAWSLGTWLLGKLLGVCGSA